MVDRIGWWCGADDDDDVLFTDDEGCCCVAFSTPFNIDGDATTPPPASTTGLLLLLLLLSLPLLFSLRALLTALSNSSRSLNTKEGSFIESSSDLRSVIDMEAGAAVILDSLGIRLASVLECVDTPLEKMMCSVDVDLSDDIRYVDGQITKEESVSPL